MAQGCEGFQSIDIQAPPSCCFIIHEFDLMIQKGCFSYYINIPARKIEKRERERHFLKIALKHTQQIKGSKYSLYYGGACIQGEFGYSATEEDGNGSCTLKNMFSASCSGGYRKEGNQILF